ncbi:MAG: recombinase family protein [Terriglobales bacterium]
MTRVAIYARVSTSNGSQYPQMQLRELREYAQRRDLQVAEEYIDNGVSGSKESRPALNRLMTDAHSRKFDAVLVWKIDRWGRSLKHFSCEEPCYRSHRACDRSDGIPEAILGLRIIELLL